VLDYTMTSKDQTPGHPLSHIHVHQSSSLITWYWPKAVTFCCWEGNYKAWWKASYCRSTTTNRLTAQDQH